MNYSTFASGFDKDEDGVIIDVSSLYARLERVTDQRDRRGLRYPLPLVLIAIVLAKMAGEDKPEGIAEWAQLRKEMFIETLGLQRPTMPSDSTYRRIVSVAVEAQELANVVSEFLSALPQVGSNAQIAIDGKTVRGTIAFGQTRGLHLLAAYLPGAGVVLAQVEVEPDTNEIGAAPTVLKMLDLQGKIVTGDALFAQRELSALIVQAGGDYVWTVKDNQPRLREDIEQLFQPEVYVKGFGPAPNDFRTAQTVTKKHGRLEKRTLIASSLLTETSDWPGLAQVFRLERETQLLASNRVRRDVVCGVTSLSAGQADPARLLGLVRRHWGIENELHYRRDVTLGEDACRVSSWCAAQVLAILNNLVLALLLRHGDNNAAQVRRRYNAHPDAALKLLVSLPSRL